MLTDKPDYRVSLLYCQEHCKDRICKYVIYEAFICQDCAKCMMLEAHSQIIHKILLALKDKPLLLLALSSHSITEFEAIRHIHVVFQTNIPGPLFLASQTTSILSRLKKHIFPYSLNPI